MSICLSIHVSVCHKSEYTKTAGRRITLTVPHNSPGSLVFFRQRPLRNSTRVTPYRGAKYRLGGLKSATLDKVSPRGRRDDRPPADGSSTTAKIAADLRPSADGSAVHTFLVAGSGKSAGSQRAYSLGSCAMGQKHGRIALGLFQNAR